MEFARRSRRLYSVMITHRNATMNTIGVLVVIRSGATATEAELRQFAREHLAHFKAPQWFSFISELPKTATGKIQKYILRRGGSAISKQ
jgi:acyl-coenzyme A synthetase/AMP-(fatty) acid ligase